MQLDDDAPTNSSRHLGRVPSFVMALRKAQFNIQVRIRSPGTQLSPSHPHILRFRTVACSKDSSEDFALWQQSHPGQDGAISTASPSDKYAPSGRSFCSAFGSHVHPSRLRPHRQRTPHARCNHTLVQQIKGQLCSPRRHPHSRATCRASST